MTRTNQPQEGLVSTTKVVRLGASKRSAAEVMIDESPLLIRLHQGQQFIDFATLMRTPGHDTALVRGFLFSESIIERALDIEAIEFIEPNEVTVTLNQNVNFDFNSAPRTYTSYSSCGICGKSSIKQLALQQRRKIDETENWLSPELLIEATLSLRHHQPLFEQTGSAHGAALVTINDSITTLACFEDVGRHNAVDKIIGDCALTNQNPHAILVLSGRISFELVQKAVMAGICVIAAIGAPTSLALQAAKQFNLTLVGFIKPEQCNVYCGDWRLTSGKVIESPQQESNSETK